MVVYNIYILNNNKNIKKVDIFLNRILKVLRGFFFDKCYGNDNMIWILIKWFLIRINEIFFGYVWVNFNVKYEFIMFFLIFLKLWNRYEKWEWKRYRWV